MGQGMRKIQIYTLSIKNMDEAIIEKWLAFVTPSQRERLFRYRFRADFLRSLAGEAMARIIAGERAGVEPEKLVIARPTGEKPFFSDYPEICFNVSHSGDWVVCAISDCAVGIDVEVVKKKGVNASLVRKVLTDKERAYMQMFSGAEAAAVFYQFWTMKEAYCKCVGGGLRIGPDRVEVDFSRRRIYLADEGREWGGMMKTIDFKEGYVMSVCGVDDFEVGVAGFKLI